MYLWHFANPELTQAVILGRDARADALRGAAYAAVRGGQAAAVGLTSGIAAGLRAALRWYRKRRAARATIGELRALNDRMLADIGLHRSEIRSVVTEVYQGTTAERRRSRGSQSAPAARTPDDADDRDLPLAA